jgi:hypothetical protein
MLETDTDQSFDIQNNAIFNNELLDTENNSIFDNELFLFNWNEE